MEARRLHPWDVSPTEAVAIQRQLAPSVRLTGSAGAVQRVAGVDISIGSRLRPRPGLGAVVVLSYPELEPVAQSIHQQSVAFPYIPGLLSFREIPVLLPAFAALEVAPDLLVVDGQGIAHPRRFGIASHLGLLFDLPAIGCAKSLLSGRYDALAEERGAVAYLHDHDEVVGAAVRTRSGVKPVFVSVGHRLTLDEAVAWVLRLTRGYRLPEPTRLADQAAAGRIIAGAG